MGSTPGEKFNIEHEGRYFEVVVPEGSNAGETITIVGVTGGEQQFETIQSIQDAALTKAMALNEYFKIQERAVAAKETVFTKAQELDAKYEITKMPLVISSTAVASNYLKIAIEKCKELDGKLKIIEKAKEIGERIVVYAKEIDKKFGVTAHTCRLIIKGANIVVPAAKFVQQKSTQAVDYVQRTKESYFPSPAVAAPTVAAK